MTVDELITKLLKLQFDATVRILNDEGVINDLEAAWLAEDNLVFVGSIEQTEGYLNLPADHHAIPRFTLKRWPSASQPENEHDRCNPPRTR